MSHWLQQDWVRHFGNFDYFRMHSWDGGETVTVSSNDSNEELFEKVEFGITKKNVMLGQSARFALSEIKRRLKAAQPYETEQELAFRLADVERERNEARGIALLTIKENKALWETLEEEPMEQKVWFRYESEVSPAKRKIEFEEVIMYAWSAGAYTQRLEALKAKREREELQRLIRERDEALGALLKNVEVKDDPAS